MDILRHKNFEAVSALFHTGNNAGHGYAVGEECNDIDAIDGIGEPLFSGSETGGIAVYRHADGLTLVGDVNGPWAVDVDFNQLAAMGH